MITYLKKLSTKIFSYFGRESASYILFLDKNDLNKEVREEGFVFMNSVSQIEGAIGSLRIENKCFRQWVKRGSILCAVSSQSNSGLPRGWLHFSGVRVVSSFQCTVDNNSAWLGPDFTPIAFRGKRLHSSIIEQRVFEAFQNHAVDVLFTGINISNITSLRNYLGCGFQIVGLLRTRRFLVFTIRRKLIYSKAVISRLKID